MDRHTTHRPSDCVLLVGMPVSLSDYDDFKAGEFESDFLATWGSTRSKFFNEVCAPVHGALRDIRKYGSHVILRADEQSLRSAFQRDVVIVFSHWTKEGIELAQRMMPPEEFCAAIPERYRGVIDLCACNPENLVIGIKRRAPEATVKHSFVETTPEIWIEITRITLQALSRHELSYTKALDLVLRQIGRAGAVREQRGG
jgi:hypothetical protein